MKKGDKHVRTSKNDKITKGWYYGLVNDVHEKTKLSKPTITIALRNNDTSTTDRREAVICALKLIKEREVV
jgi:hypothetical protein